MEKKVMAAGKTAIQVFNSDKFGTIRTAGTADEPLFCLVDICKALELNASQVVRRLDSTVFSKHPAQTGFGVKEINFVNEDGLYDVILDSRKPEAKAFRKWVTSEVLPSIRKTGGYIAAKADESPEVIMARALRVADDTIRRQQAQLQAANDTIDEQRGLIDMQDGVISEKSAQLRRLIPFANYAIEVIEDNTATYTMTQVAQFLGFANVAAFMDWTVRSGILHRQRGRWMPTAAYLGKGYFTTRIYRRVANASCIEESYYTVVTERGRKMLYDAMDLWTDPDWKGDVIPAETVDTEIVEGGAL